jgi:Yip1 domain
MEFSLRSVLQLARLSVQSPRAAARRLLDLRLSHQAIWLIFAFSIIPSVLISQIAFRFLPPEVQAFWADAMSRPIQTALQQGAFWLLATVALHRLGRWSSRSGTFFETLLIVAWWQIIFVGFQIAQILIYIVLVIYLPLGEVVTIAGLVLLFWCLTQFVVELHDFRSGWLTFLGIIGALLLAAIVLLIGLVTLLTVLGQGAVVNV